MMSEAEWPCFGEDDWLDGDNWHSVRWAREPDGRIVKRHWLNALLISEEFKG